MKKFLENPAPPNVVWFMLFYDLVIAAAFGQTTDFYTDESTWGVMGFVAVCNLFLYLLWIMTSLELLANSGRNSLQKLFGLVQILALSLMAIALGWDSGLTNFWGLLGVAIAVLSLVGLILSSRSISYSKRLVPWLLFTSAVFLTGALLSAVGVFTEESQIIAFFIAGVVVMLLSSVSVIWRRIADDSTVKPHALNERFGMLLLIVLGETFIVLVNTLGAIGGIPQPLYFLLAIVVVFSIWLMYFPQIAQFARPGTVRLSAARFSAHFVLVVCSANAVAAYASQAILTPSSEEIGWGSDDWTSLPLVVLLLAIVWLGYLESSRWSVVQTIHSVVAGLILILAMLGTLDNYDFGGFTLALSAVIFLLDAIVTDVVSRSRNSLDINSLSAQSL